MSGLHLSPGICLLPTLYLTQCKRVIGSPACEDRTAVGIDIWLYLPRQAQCDACVASKAKHAAFVHRMVGVTVQLCATPAQIASVAIFCASLAGDLDPIFASLVGAWKAGDPLALDLLLDHVHRGLPMHVRGWPKADKHGTGNNPHVFFRIGAPRAVGRTLDLLPVHTRADYQCTCGIDGGEAYQRAHMISLRYDLRALAAAYASTLLNEGSLDEDGLPAADYSSTEA